jgi:hypothetical protein
LDVAFLIQRETMKFVVQAVLGLSLLVANAAFAADTALEMTRFYNTPYGKQLIYRKYNSPAHIIIPGMRVAVPPEEMKERKRPAYARASKELADAEPVIEHEAFSLLQQINKEKR